MFLLLELAGIIFGLLLVLSHAFQSRRTGRSLIDAALVSASAWIAEESAILLYGVYEYSSAWHLFLDRVPLLVVVIWPVVIFSARDLTFRLWSAHPAKGILAGAAVVASDSLFIEPLAVSAGLWSWELPGLLKVPPIGILGWFFFAMMTMLLLERNRPQRPAAWRRALLFPLLSAAGTHLLLQMTWWGALRWVNFSLPTPAVLGTVWFGSVLTAMALYHQRAGRWITKRTLLLRLPAVLFFFALVLFRSPDPIPLFGYALAFVPPYGVLMVQQYRYRRHRGKADFLPE